MSTKLIILLFNMAYLSSASLVLYSLYANAVNNDLLTPSKFSGIYNYFGSSSSGSFDGSCLIGIANL